MERDEFEQFAGRDLVRRGVAEHGRVVDPAHQPAVVLGDVRGSGRVGLGAGVARYPGDARMFTCPGQSLSVAIDRDHVPGVAQALADRAADAAGCACDYVGLRHLVRIIVFGIASAGRLPALICGPEAAGPPRQSSCGAATRRHSRHARSRRSCQRGLVFVCPWCVRRARRRKEDRPKRGKAASLHGHGVARGGPVRLIGEHANQRSTSRDGALLNRERLRRGETEPEQWSPARNPYAIAVSCHFARTAPLRPKIDDHRFVVLRQFAVKVRFVKRDNGRIFHS